MSLTRIVVNVRTSKVEYPCNFIKHVYNSPNYLFLLKLFPKRKYFSWERCPWSFGKHEILTLSIDLLPEYLTSRGKTLFFFLWGLSEAQTLSTGFSATAISLDSFFSNACLIELASAKNCCIIDIRMFDFFSKFYLLISSSHQSRPSACYRVSCDQDISEGSTTLVFCGPTVEINSCHVGTSE